MAIKRNLALNSNKDVPTVRTKFWTADGRPKLISRSIAAIISSFNALLKVQTFWVQANASNI